MTTLVFRDGVLAADSRTSNGDVIAPGATRKVRRLPDGRLVGHTGHTAEAAAFVRWLESDSNEDHPALEDARVVVVDPAGAIRVYEGPGWYQAEGSEFFAWGSGAAAALGALHVGASAEKAVRAACCVDPASGGLVQSVALDA